MASHAPTASAVAEILSGLFAREVQARERSAPPAVAEQDAIALFVDVDGRPVAVTVAQLSLAAGAGAALALIPGAAAEQCVSTGTLTPDMLDNYYEVQNVAAQLLRSQSSGRVVLNSVVVGPAACSGEAAALIDGAEAASYDIEIGGYPGGALTYFVAQ